MNFVEQDWLYEEEMQQVLGLVFEVRNKLGAGRSEEIYHQALVTLLEKSEIPYLSKPRKSLYHRDTLIQTFEADFIVWEKIILELKVLRDYRQRDFPKQNQLQLLRYLKFFKHELGSLINFAHSKVGICRMIYEEKSIGFDEDFDRMLPHVNENDKQLLRKVRTHIKDIGKQYNYGYSSSTYQSIIAVELAHQGIECVSDLNIPATFDGKRIGSQTTTCILVENRFLLNINGKIEGPTVHDFLATRTFLDELNLKVGWVVNFGRELLTIKATVSKADEYPYP